MPKYKVGDKLSHTNAQSHSYCTITSSDTLKYNLHWKHNSNPELDTYNSHCIRDIDNNVYGYWSYVRSSIESYVEAKLKEAGYA